MSGPPPVGGVATVLLAPNPGPMTLTGTNTWLLRAPGSAEAVVVDPGPADEGHLSAVSRQGPVALIMLTHGHPDHSAGARRLAELVDAPVAAVDPAHRAGRRGLRPGQRLRLAGLSIEVVGTPGHSADSVCLWLPASRLLLTGDTVLGEGSTVVAHPDGRLVDYLASLRLLRALAARRNAAALLPGHGPVRVDPVPLLDGYLAHRAARLAQVRAALAAGASTPAEVVRTVYTDVPEVLWPAAELSVRAQLDYLTGADGG